MIIRVYLLNNYYYYLSWKLISHYILLIHTFVYLIDFFFILFWAYIVCFDIIIFSKQNSRHFYVLHNTQCFYFLIFLSTYLIKNDPIHNTWLTLHFRLRNEYIKNYNQERLCLVIFFYWTMYSLYICILAVYYSICLILVYTSQRCEIRKKINDLHSY